MLAGGLRPLPGRLVTDSRSALGARRARPHATPFAQQHLKFHGPPNSGRSVAEWAPSLKKATGASRPSLQQRLPGAEGPPEGRSTAPRHAACGGPIPSSRGPVLICHICVRGLMGKVGEIENACFLVFRALPATAVPQASKSGNMWAARDRRLGPRPKKGYARVLASTKATCGIRR